MPEIAVRLDDLQGGSAYCFVDHRATFIADTPDEVGAVIERAEQAAAAGGWVVGFVAYEAAVAFDTAFRVAPRHESGMPLVRFDVFDARIDVASLDYADPPKHSIRDLRRSSGSMPYPDAVENIRERIALGDAYQVNYTDRMVGRLDGDPFDLYVSMALAQRGAFNAYLDYDHHVIVSASPEMFLRWDGDVIATKPMKGTVVRGRRSADDEARRQELVSDPKQQAENVMIVDLLRNDLSRIADLGSVKVPSLFEAERYETVWQLTSTVTARPRVGVGLRDLFAATFPCGSITGAPKASAMSIIADLEARPRGVYCGAIGVLAPPGHGARATFSVAIRTAVVERPLGDLVYGVGGGITWSSNPLAEDAEVVAKARVLSERRPPSRLLETLAIGPEGIRHRQRHVDRLMASAAWFGFSAVERDVADAVDAVTRPAEISRLRLLLDRHGHVEVTVTALASAPGTVRLALDHQFVRSDDVFCLHKTTNRAVYEDAASRHPGADDVILVNERGEVVETTVANLLYRLGDDWFTPPLSSGGLNGIGRAIELDEGRAIERVLFASELDDCDELAVVSSLRGKRHAVLD